MLKPNPDQIELLVKALEKIQNNNGDFPPHLITSGESADFYLGVVSGLLISHQLWNNSLKGNQPPYSQLLSLGAAIAARQYLNVRDSEELIFPEFLDIE